MSWFWNNWFKRLGFGGQEGRRRSRKDTQKLSRPGPNSAWIPWSSEICCPSTCRRLTHPLPVTETN
jgi:hypothetical protein